MATARAVSWRLFGLLFGAAALVWITDLLVKEWVVSTLREGQQVEVLGEVLQWHFVRNPGAAFSLASGMTWIFTIVASLVAVFIVVQARRIHSVRWALVLGGLLGGVVGNLTDRLVREPGMLQGHVIDFIQVIGFPAIFNIADIFVVSAMAGFMLLVLRGVGLDGVRRSDEPVGADATPSTATDGGTATAGETSATGSTSEPATTEPDPRRED